MNSRFWKNLTSLYCVHIVSYIVPLLTLPYLARVLGPRAWGALALADAFGSYISLLIEYGFGYSACREVARKPDDLHVRSTQLSAVIIAQALLSAGALALTFALSFFLRGLEGYRSLLPFAFILAVARAMAPFWYLQALEQMGIVAIPNLVTNLLAAAAMFLLVRSPADTWLALAVRGAAAMGCTVFGFVIAFRQVRFRWPNSASIRSIFREGRSLFLFRSATSIFTTANVVLLGFFTSPIIVGWYAGAEKIARAAVNGLTPVSQAFYPRLNSQLAQGPKGATRTLRASAFVTIGLGLLLGLALFFGAPIIIRVALGRGFENSVIALRILAFLAPLVAVTNVFGLQWMLALKMDAAFSRLIGLAGMANIAVATILAPRFQHVGMSISVVVADTIVAGGTLVILALSREYVAAATSGEHVVSASSPKQIAALPG